MCVCVSSEHLAILMFFYISCAVLLLMLFSRCLVIVITNYHWAGVSVFLSIDIFQKSCLDWQNFFNEGGGV